MTADLTAWLLAQIAAEEERARAAIDDDAHWLHVGDGYIIQGSEGFAVTSDWLTLPHRFEAADHIAANDPAATLRRCAAYRTIVEAHVAVDWGRPPSTPVLLCRHCNDQRWPCPTLRALATIYADADGYDPAWRLT